MFFLLSNRSATISIRMLESSVSLGSDVCVLLIRCLSWRVEYTIAKTYFIGAAGEYVEPLYLFFRFSAGPSRGGHLLDFLNFSEEEEGAPGGYQEPSPSYFILVRGSETKRRFRIFPSSHSAGDRRVSCQPWQSGFTSR